MTADLITLPRLNCKDIQRFFSKIRLSETNTYRNAPCWEWTAGLTEDGYARFRVKGKRYGAHRVAYAWLVGPIPPYGAKENLDHRCNNPRCVNPVHLEIEDALVNLMRGNCAPARNSRKTECKNGHPLSGENLFINPRGHRGCRTCRRQQSRDLYNKHPERSAQYSRTYYAKHIEKCRKSVAEKGRLRRKRKRELEATDEESVISRPTAVMHKRIV